MRKVAIGEVFGKLTVLSAGAMDQWNHGTFLCRCACGSEKVVRSAHLLNGRSTSCGLCVPRGRKRNKLIAWANGHRNRK
jgi:hypothetical protein